MINRATLKGLVFVGLLMGGGASIAAPTISGTSGTWDHDAVITISGSSFGTKPAAAPVLWDTVEDNYSGLSDGDSIPNAAGGGVWYSNSNGGNHVKYETTAGEQRSAASAATYKVTSQIEGYLSDVSWTATDSVYVSWWWKQGSDVSGGDHSSKYLRVSDSSDETNKTSSVAQTLSHLYSNPDYCAIEWVTIAPTPNDWVFFEVWYDNSGRNFSVRLNGQYLINGVATTGCTVAPQLNEVWKIGWDGGGNAPPALSWWMDDIYIDSSFARVMLGNASTYAASTHFEMQKATSWATGSVQINANVGTYTNAQTVYLYVVDSTGAVNSTGYPVTIGAGGGGGSDTTPDAFDFTNQTDRNLSTQYTSNSQTVTDIDAATAITVTGAEFQKNGAGSWLTSDTVVSGDSIQLRRTTGASYSTAYSTTIDIGGVTDTWTLTTRAQINTFSFASVPPVVELSTQYTSDTITVSGAATGLPISVTNGEYNINGGAFTSASSTCTGGDVIRVRHTSSGSNSTSVVTTLTIDGRQGTFTSVTKAGAGGSPPLPPSNFQINIL